jgi:hypothetical protein
MRIGLKGIAALAVVALIVGLAGAAFATVSTDQADYSPGSTVTIRGANDINHIYTPGESVHVDVSGPNGYTSQCDGTVALDDAGAWSCQVTLNGDDSAVGSYNYTATGTQSGVSEQGLFTDQPVDTATPVQWDGHGANKTPADAPVYGTCDTVGNFPDLEPEPGQQGWLFILTKPYDSNGSQLTFSFSNGTVVTASPVPGDFVGQDAAENGEKTYHYVVYTSAGAILQSASATNGTFQTPPGAVQSNLNVSHCELGDTVTPPAIPPTVEKTASGSYDNTYTWGITKSVDKTSVTTAASTAPVNYTVKVLHGDSQPSNGKVTGTIGVTNPNTDQVTISGVTDQLSDGTSCTVTNGGSQSLASGTTNFAYECDNVDVSGGAPSNLTNTATVTWGDQPLAGGSHLDAGSKDFVTGAIGFTAKKIDECVNVVDDQSGNLGAACVGDANPTTFTYQRILNIIPNTCTDYPNTATFTTDDTSATGSASQSVHVCGPVTGGLTMGFWQNNNGQALIKNGAAPGGVCASGTYLKTTYNPFKDLTGTSCAQVATYVTSVIKAANASGASMNAMLKGQMLATALDVFFNKVGPTVKVDLKMIPKPVTSTNYENTSAAFGGNTCRSVNNLLTDASSSAASAQGNPSASPWYGQVKATQELAKDTFDAINNAKAFAC